MGFQYCIDLLSALLWASWNCFSSNFICSSSSWRSLLQSFLSDERSWKREVKIVNGRKHRRLSHRALTIMFKNSSLADPNTWCRWIWNPQKSKKTYFNTTEEVTLCKGKKSFKSNHNLKAETYPKTDLTEMALIEEENKPYSSFSMLNQKMFKTCKYFMY